MPLDEQSREYAGVALDGTGVGAPVVELLRSAGLECGVTAVTITGGEKASGSGGAWSVPKRDLIAGVQLALEKGELRIARHMKDAGALVRELIDVRITAGLGTGKVRIGAHGSGQHDDLVIALALACWRARWKENGFGTGRLAQGLIMSIAGYLNRPGRRQVTKGEQIQGTAGREETGEEEE